jgi:superfamily II DNA or RNA helicase
MRYVQIIGRALRLGEGKDHAVILDHSDTTSRLGLVTDIHHDELDDGRPKTEREKPEPKVKLPKECVECSFLMPVGTTICPNCGAERKPQNFIVEQNGELVEYTEDGRRVGSRMASDPTPDQKRYVYAQILGYAEETGKSDGWVAHTYRDMFGVWPRGMRGVRAEPCLTKVRNFIRAKAKAYWESKQREAGHVQA